MGYTNEAGDVTCGAADDHPQRRTWKVKERPFLDSYMDTPVPEFLECLTCRWREHVGPNEDFDQGYRDRAEAEPWFARDPVATTAALLPQDVRAAIDQTVEAEIAAALRFAEASAFPGSDELTAHVFA